jgi:hypothetical protein
VTKLHEILRPFLLRRLKKDVLLKMPPKKEIVVYCGMSSLQVRVGELSNAVWFVALNCIILDSPCVWGQYVTPFNYAEYSGSLTFSLFEVIPWQLMRVLPAQLNEAVDCF